MSDPYAFGSLAPMDEAAQAELAREVAAQRARQAVMGRQQAPVPESQGSFLHTLLNKIHSIPTTEMLPPPPENGEADPYAGARRRIGRTEAIFGSLSGAPSILGAADAVDRGDMGTAALYGTAAAAPYAAGPAMRGASALLQRFPKSAALGAGGAGVLTSADAADRNSASPEWWRTPREQPPTVAPFVEPGLTPEETQRYTAQPPPGFESLGPMGKKEAMARVQAAQTPLTASRDAFLKDKISGARADWDKSVQGQQAAYEAEQARMDKEDEVYKLANQSFREAHPYASPVIQGAGAGTALAFPLGARWLTQRRNNKMVDQLDSAIAQGEAALAAKGKGVTTARDVARERLQSVTGPAGVGRIKDTAVSLPGQAAWAAGGGAEGAATSLIPYVSDQETLPVGSHGQTESSDPMNWATRAAYGFIPGAAMGMLGARVPMSMGRVPDVAHAEGLIKGLTVKPKLPPVEPVSRATSKPAPRRKKQVPTED